MPADAWWAWAVAIDTEPIRLPGESGDQFAAALDPDLAQRLA